MKYKAGIIGCGRVASMFDDLKNIQKPRSHAGAYTEYEHTELVAASDINKLRLEGFAKRWNVKNIYLDYQEMLEKEDIDILSICTHAQSHRDICMNAARTNMQAIFCEKPISTNLREADDMIRSCNKKNILLTVNHIRRWDTYFQSIKDIIKQGGIGDIETLVCHSLAGLLNNGTHMFDLLRYYCGDVSWLFGHIISDDSTDPNGVGLLQFKNGSHALIDVGFRDYPLHGVNIIGTDGMIKGTGMINADNDFEILNTIASVSDILPRLKPWASKDKNLDGTQDLSNIVPASTTTAFKEEGLTSCPQALDSGLPDPIKHVMQRRYLNMSIDESVIHPSNKLGGILTEGHKVKGMPEQNIKKPVLKKLEYKRWKTPMYNAIEDIVHSIEEGVPTKCTGEDGRAALEIAIAFFESERTENKIYFPVENRHLRVIPRDTSYTRDGTMGD